MNESVWAMDEKRYTIEAADGTALVFRTAAPESGVRGVICLVHGLGDYSGCFSYLFEYFSEASFAVIAIDLHGNGESGGQRGNISNYDILYDDIGLVIQKAKDLYPGKNIFLYGHSLGGNLVLNFTLQRKPDIAGVISSSPWLKLKSHPFLTRSIAYLTDNIKPDYILNAGIDAKKLSHDASFIETYESDSLVHGYISAHLLAETLRSGNWAIEHAGEFTLPLLLMHGGGDRITDKEATRQFFQHVEKDKAIMKIWDGNFHSLHNELNRNEIFAFVQSFITSVENRQNFLSL